MALSDLYSQPRLKPAAPVGPHGEPRVGPDLRIVGPSRPARVRPFAPVPQVTVQALPDITPAAPVAATPAERTLAQILAEEAIMALSEAGSGAMRDIHRWSTPYRAGRAGADTWMIGEPVPGRSVLSAGANALGAADRALSNTPVARFYSDAQEWSAGMGDPFDPGGVLLHELGGTVADAPASAALAVRGLPRVRPPAPAAAAETPVEAVTAVGMPTAPRGFPPVSEGPLSSTSIAAGRGQNAGLSDTLAQLQGQRAAREAGGRAVPFRGSTPAGEAAAARTDRILNPQLGDPLHPRVSTRDLPPDPMFSTRRQAAAARDELTAMRLRRLRQNNAELLQATHLDDATKIQMLVENGVDPNDARILVEGVGRAGGPFPGRQGSMD